MLEVCRLTVAHGSLEAVRDVSFEVPTGTVVAVLGPNGAGKTSILEAVSGMRRPVGGRISFQGERIEALPPHAVWRRGIAHVPENRLIFMRLTVEENLAVAAASHMSRAQAGRQRDRVLEHMPELVARLGAPASALSGGQQQLLAVGRGLMADPRLLILDEPTLGLSPLATEGVFDLVARLAADGLSILLVDQNVLRVLDAADEVHVMDKGRIVLSGAGRVLANEPLFNEALLGVTRRAPYEEKS